ncbi:MAG TPA: endonuclease domain-containing protein [Hyphomicrobiaceae bacterium]|jgi:very-short-patch-repair endonuclease
MANEYARYLRKNKTSAERRLWRELRPLEQVGFKFRQQVPIDRFIVDFACLSQRLIIEVDGGTHSSEAELRKDAVRERYLRDQGFRVLRFWNADVRENMQGVMDTVVAALETPTPDPSPQGGGETLGARAAARNNER